MDAILLPFLILTLILRSFWSIQKNASESENSRKSLPIWIANKFNEFSWLSLGALIFATPSGILAVQIYLSEPLGVIPYPYNPVFTRMMHFAIAIPFGICGFILGITALFRAGHGKLLAIIAIGLALPAILVFLSWLFI